MGTTIAHLFHYPIKGLSAESMMCATLAAGRAFPGDRRFALRHAASAFDAAQPTWQRKREFAMLAHTAELAKLNTSLDVATGALCVSTSGSAIFIGNISTDAGRCGAQNAISAVINDSRGSLQLVDAGEIALTDSNKPYLSIINLAALKDMADKIGQPVDVARFRGNIIIDGLAPWAEFEWVGKTICIGSAELTVTKRIERCAATTVNPATAARDLDVPSLLRQHYGHVDCGVFAEVVAGGEVCVGHAVTAE